MLRRYAGARPDCVLWIAVANPRRKADGRGSGMPLSLTWMKRSEKK